MDAVKFLEESIRMCKSYPFCDGCEMEDADSDIPCNMSQNITNVTDYGNIVKIVEKWAKDHSKRTRQSEFLKHYPDAQINGNGVVDIAPCAVERHRFFKYGKTTCNTPEKPCKECMEQYWMEEID